MCEMVGSREFARGPSESPRVYKYIRPKHRLKRSRYEVVRTVSTSSVKGTTGVRVMSKDREVHYVGIMI
jgi:hypothetical protein